ncbi:MAG: histidine--tRNA ligase [Phycisphaeraceae bacterium]|nr:histidine--tRNA ligase [Phycisphaeraceae bacterium]
MASDHTFQAPTGTRDFYPTDLNRLRYVTEAWRRTSIVHGFDQIDGPTFEHLDLYTVKSGEGIVSELFSFERAGGEKTYALRPEFTPTLARMYAARANALPRPTRWFCTPSFFRAERPQRGRLREFTQWNCDILGDDSVQADAELIACAVESLRALGLSPEHVKVRISHRGAVEQMLTKRGVEPERHAEYFGLLDKVGKISNDAFIEAARKLGMDAPEAVKLLATMAQTTRYEAPTTQVMLHQETPGAPAEYFRALFAALDQLDASEWCVLNLGIVRGLAYYTGMVFEIHEANGAERAIAGGGRYDRLIELFGGPPTPAVGFGMGDVVLSLVLQDRGLMPTDDQIADRLGLRPDAMIFSNGTPEADALVPRVAAALRREGLHARRSAKSTRNVGKLLQDAAKARARFAVIVESDTLATIKDLASGRQEQVPIGEVPPWLRRL